MACVLGQPAAAQDTIQRELQESRERLEALRREREQLQRELDVLRAEARDVAGEMVNIERQAQTSANALRELDFQALALARRIEETTGDLLRTRDRLRERQTVLDFRIRSIYKRGPLHRLQVLFGADSFSDLLNRYRYLHLIAVHDRMLVDEVQRLEQLLAENEQQLSATLVELQRLRAERLAEMAELQVLETQHEQTLRGYEIQERQTAERIRQIARDEARLTDLVNQLERRRQEEERRRVIAGGPPDRAATISPASLGTLNWPVDGDLLYRFGAYRRPDGIVLRWNGVGISARGGTPVLAVQAGTVVSAMPLEGYGPSVIISHGGGYYTLYVRLGSVGVSEGQLIDEGNVIGTVGGERTPEGPHIEFRVYAPGPTGSPVPVDPLPWLRERR